MPISCDIVTWPGDPRIGREVMGDRVKVSRWTLGSHTGTHVDAPTHFSAGHTTVDQLDPEALIGPCRVFHLPDAPLITREILEQLPLQGVSRVLFRTRNSDRWAQDTGTFFEDFTALDAQAALMLMDLNVKLVGLDALSIGPFRGGAEVHDLLLGQGIIPLEGLYLPQAPAGDYQLICAPLKLMEADGAPARVFLVG